MPALPLIEPLLTEGYGRLTVSKIPETFLYRVGEVEEAAIKLYEGWGKPEKIAEWKAKRAKSKP